MPASNEPSSSGVFRSAAYRSSPDEDGRPEFPITTSTGLSMAWATHRAASAAVKPSMPGPSVTRFAIRMIGPRISASASLTPRTRSGGIRLVKKLPGPMTTASNSRLALATTGWMAACGSSQTRRTW
jgi:hypothetical protein